MTRAFASVWLSALAASVAAGVAVDWRFLGWAAATTCLVPYITLASWERLR